MIAHTLRILFVVSVIFAAPALAQQRAAISGTLTDTSGAVVPGAVVDALAGGQVIASATSGGDGRYRLNVPVGQRVTLRARLRGFADETAEVTAGDDAVRDLTLRVAAVGDILVVTAARTAETRLSTTASVAVFDAADIQALGSKSIADIVRFVPGVNVEGTGREGALTTLFTRGGSEGPARLVKTWTTAPIASEPSSDDCPPRTISTRSMSAAEMRLKSKVPPVSLTRTPSMSTRL